MNITELLQEIENYFEDKLEPDCTCVQCAQIRPLLSRVRAALAEREQLDSKYETLADLARRAIAELEGEVRHLKHVIAGMQAAEGMVRMGFEPKRKMRIIKQHTQYEPQGKGG